MAGVEAVIRWEVDKASELPTLSGFRYSPVHFMAGLPWRLAVRTDEDDGSLLWLVVCNEESDCDIWMVHWFAEISVINRDDPEESTYNGFGCWFTKNERGMVDSSITTEEIVDPAMGFIKDDKIIVEATIDIRSISGVRDAPVHDFSLLVPGRGDSIALIIEGEKVYTSKEILTIHSPVFSSMFFGDFVEKDQEEMELKGVRYEELLHVIYPSERVVTVDSYKFLLALADHFQIENVSHGVERYLIKSELVTTCEKLIMADQYRLKMLKNVIMDSFKKPTDVKAVEMDKEYNDLPIETLRELFSKMCSLI